MKSAIIIQKSEIRSLRSTAPRAHVVPALDLHTGGERRVFLPREADSQPGAAVPAPASARHRHTFVTGTRDPRPGRSLAAIEQRELIIDCFEHDSILRLIEPQRTPRARRQMFHAACSTSIRSHSLSPLSFRLVSSISLPMAGEILRPRLLRASARPSASNSSHDTSPASTRRRAAP